MTTKTDPDAATGCADDQIWRGVPVEALRAAMTTPDAAILWAEERSMVGRNPNWTTEDITAAHRAGQAHIAARLRERADAATGSAQAVMYEIVRMIEEGTL